MRIPVCLHLRLELDRLAPPFGRLWDLSVHAIICGCCAVCAGCCCAWTGLPRASRTSAAAVIHPAGRLSPAAAARLFRTVIASGLAATASSAVRPSSPMVSRTVPTRWMSVLSGMVRSSGMGGMGGMCCGVWLVTAWWSGFQWPASQSPMSVLPRAAWSVSVMLASLWLDDDDDGEDGGEED